MQKGTLFADFFTGSQKTAPSVTASAVTTPSGTASPCQPSALYSLVSATGSSEYNVPRRGRSRLQVEVTLVNEKITEIFDFVILVKLFMLTDCTSLEEEGHGAV